LTESVHKPLPKIQGKMREYQIEGYNWLAFLYEHRFGGCLADDMGLGKTIQAISLLAGIKEKIVVSPNKKQKKLCHLVIVPPSLIFNWRNEIDKFYPDFKVVEYVGSERNINFEDIDIIITTYGLVLRDIDKLKDILFDVVIFDEAQIIKNIYAGRTSAARSIKGNFKLCLTGTPLENHLGEYYSILDLAISGLFDDYNDFRKKVNVEDLELVISRSRPFVLRRTKEEILKDLPKKIESDVYLDLTEHQKVLYNKIVKEVRDVIDAAYHNKTRAQAGIISITAILRLRQICVSPRLIMPDFEGHSPKIDYLIGKLKELEEEGHCALIFSQFTTFLDVIEDALKKSKLRYVRMDGDTPVFKRKRIVESFQESKEPTFFLISLKTGGMGLNLTKANYVFHLDPWWNPAVENQASDRTHRIGQKNMVFVTRLLMRHTIEEKMMFLKKNKADLFRSVIDSGILKDNKLTISKEDFDFLLS